MNKGIIMEKHRNYNIVLTRDGSFKKAKVTHEDNEIGEEIKFELYIRKSIIQLPTVMKLGVISTLVGFLIFISFSFIEENETYAYITVDVNPSIAIEVDDLLQVQNITALNADAEILLQEFSSYQHEDLELIIEEIMYESEKKNLTNDEKNILIGVSYINESEKQIVNNINQYFTKKNTDWEIITFNVPSTVREKAIGNQTSMNEEFAILISDKDNKLEDKVNISEKQRNSIASFYNIESEVKKEEHKSKQKNESHREINKLKENPIKKEEIDPSSSIKTVEPQINRATKKSSDVEVNSESERKKVNSNVNKNAEKESSKVEIKKKNDQSNSKQESKIKSNEHNKVTPKKYQQQDNGVKENHEKKHQKKKTEKHNKEKNKKQPEDDHKNHEKNKHEDKTKKEKKPKHKYKEDKGNQGKK